MSKHESGLTPADASRANREVVPLREANGETWNHATVIGDLEAEAAQAVLNAPISVMFAPNRRTSGKRWERLEGIVREIIDGLLSLHPVKSEKDDGLACYARGKRMGSHTVDGIKKAYVARRKDLIEEVTALVIDVDGTDSFDRVTQAIQDEGWFAVVATTYSHAEKGRDGAERFRVVLFLSEPCAFPSEQGARVSAVAKWESLYVGVCETLGFTDIDASAMRINQAAYVPARPSANAPFRHVIIAGRALDLSNVAPGDASKYKKSAPVMGSGKKLSAQDAAPAVLSDGFDLLSWWDDGGSELLIESFLDDLGWDDRGAAGDGRTILCPNDAQHSNPGDPADPGCWACESFGDGFVITCHHDHCGGVHTWDNLRLIEAAILDGEFHLPDEFASLSDMLCAAEYYPDEIDGEPVSFSKYDYGVEEVIELTPLRTAKAVKRAFDALAKNSNAGEDHVAAICAGVEMAGNKARAVEELDTQLKARLSSNDAKRLKKKGAERLKAQQAAYAATQRQDHKAKVRAAIEDGVPANVSLDIADPLGETLEESVATLAHRHVIADFDGKVRVLRKPDLSALRDTGATLRHVVTAQTVEDFKLFYQNRKVVVGSGEAAVLRNPAEEFVENSDRKSGVVFAPPPASAGQNEFNMYYGRTLEPGDGYCPTIARFTFQIVCGGRKDIWRWILLWLAHMVQRPGEKPGTAIVLHGAGGAGKSTFGQILDKLTAPHCRTLDKGEHVTGRFAGDHLSTTICAVCAEAAFARDPRVQNELKSLVTQPTQAVERKGLGVTECQSYLRLFFDSNSSHAVGIEGNGSERRYLVMKINERRRGERDYWNAVYKAIDGPEMAAFLGWLLDLVPSDLGLSWDDVRVAPSTPERDAMAYQSLRQSHVAFLRIIEDGSVSLDMEDGRETFTFDDGPMRLPRAALNTYLGAKGDTRVADDGDAEKIAVKLFGEAVGEWDTVTRGRGSVCPGDKRDVRWIELPPRRMLLEEIGKRYGREVRE